ncbi:hypothetical protein F4V91_32290 [Neorhizobium galegae]|uniref:Uncharacterized protein n=1 Tax=Neorhizobium galegae TaxID=399 RepID=A0A6A1TFX1_NEOGA|nr:hypothetical protein [Neorhizobium galegae]KAB1082623.1 hypothetical protein F4V91_32290 [Neorhizobium galegae]
MVPGDTGSGGAPGRSDTSAAGSDRSSGDRSGGDRGNKAADNVSKSDSVTTTNGWTVSGEMGKEIATRAEPAGDGAISLHTQYGAEGFSQDHHSYSFTEGASISAPTPHADSGHDRSAAGDTGARGSDNSGMPNQAEAPANPNNSDSGNGSDGAGKTDGDQPTRTADGGNASDAKSEQGTSSGADGSSASRQGGGHEGTGATGNDAGRGDQKDGGNTSDAKPEQGTSSGADGSSASWHGGGHEGTGVAGNDAGRGEGPAAGDARDKAGAGASDRTPPGNGVLSPFEEILDGIVNPSPKDHPFQYGVMENMRHRGEAIVGGFVESMNQQSAFMNAVAEGRIGDAIVMRGKDIGDSAKGAVVGFGHSVATAGRAMGDLAYYGTHMEEPGAAEKLGNATVDGVLEAANIVGAVDGAASVTKLGVAAVGKDALREGLAAGEEGLQADAGGAGNHGAMPPELPPPEAPPPGGAGGAPKPTTESIFGEINQELANVPEAEGPLPNGHRGPGIGGYSGVPQETGVYRQDGGHHVHQGANYAPQGTPTRNAPGYRDGTTVDLSQGEHANVHRVTNAVNRGLHGAEVDRAIGGDISAGQYGTRFGEGTAYNGPGVHVRATGDGTRAAVGAPPATPWTVDTTGYYGLRASGDPIQGTIQGALDAVIQSDRALDAAGVQPVRVPKR